MTIAQKVILGALLLVGALCLIVGFTLMHHIGGFIQTVEEEAREEEKKRAEEERQRAEASAGENHKQTGAEQ